MWRRSFVAGLMALPCLLSCADRSSEPSTAPPIFLAAAPADCAAFETVANQTTLFWSVLCEPETEHGPGGHLLAVPKTGGAVRDLAIADAFFSLAADDEALYFSSVDLAAMILSLQRLNLDETAPHVLHRVGLFQSQKPHRIAIDAANVYFADGFPDGGIYAIPKTGGTPVTVATLSFGATIALDGTTVYASTGCVDFMVCGEEPAGSGRIVAVPKAGGDPSELVKGQHWIEEVVISGDTMYWSSADGTKAAPSSGGSERMLSPEPSVGLSVAGDKVFVSTADSIRMMPEAGGTERVLASGISVADIVADGSSVYWADALTGAAMRVDY